MRLTLVAPFRIPFRLPKDEILANHSKWIDVINNAQKQLAKDGYPEEALGNYGWGRLKKLHEEDAVFYGKTGIDDPGWFFKKYYLFRISGQFTFSEITSPADDAHLIKLIESDRREYRLIDNTVAILVFSFKVKKQEFLNYVDNDNNNLSRYAESTNNWAKKLIEIHEKNNLEASIKWCYENLFKPMGFKLEQNDNTGYFIDKESPILGYKLAIEDKTGLPIDKESSNYGKFYKRLWAHWAYIFEPKEKNNLSE